MVGMHHFHFTSAIDVYTNFEDGLVVIKNMDRKDVVKSIENLYGTCISMPARASQLRLSALLKMLIR